MMKRLFCILLALMLALVCLSSALGEEDTVVRVNDKRYSRKDIQAYYDAAAENFIATGGENTKENQAALLDMVIDGYADLGAIELKCDELGLSSLTEEDEVKLQQSVQAGWDQLTEQCIQQLMSQYSQTREEAEEAAPLMLKVNGYTPELLYDQAFNALRNARILAYVTDGVDITDAQLQAYYEENYAAADRALYENNISAYETYTLANGNFSCYTPAGYRCVGCILFPASEEEVNALKAYANDASADAETFRLTVRDRLLTQYASPLAEIEKRLAAGESVSSIAPDFADTDIVFTEGYPVHAESIFWQDLFKTAALALEKIGDVSDPLLMYDGLNLLQYVSDVSEGYASLSDPASAEVRDYLLEQYRINLLNEQVEVWKQAYDIELHPELLTLPTALQ